MQNCVLSGAKRFTNPDTSGFRILIWLGHGAKNLIGKLAEKNFPQENLYVWRHSGKWDKKLDPWHFTFASTPHKKKRELIPFFFILLSFCANDCQKKRRENCSRVKICTGEKFFSPPENAELRRGQWPRIGTGADRRWRSAGIFAGTDNPPCNSSLRLPGGSGTRKNWMAKTFEGRAEKFGRLPRMKAKSYLISPFFRCLVPKPSRSCRESAHDYRYRTGQILRFKSCLIKNSRAKNRNLYPMSKLYPQNAYFTISIALCKRNKN